MENLLSNPAWLFGYDVIFKFVIALITAAVSYYSFKMYRLSGVKKSKLLGVSFSFLALSYLAHGFFSLISFSNPTKFLAYNLLGIYLHMVFFIIGITTLTYMTLNVKKPRLLTLMISLSISLFVFSGNALYIGYAVISIMLIYILFHHSFYVL